MSDGPVRAADLAPGDLIRAVFPRMAGKERPGLVIAVIRSGERVSALVAAPITSRRSNQPGRLALGGAGGLTAASQAILPLTAALPPGAARARIGAVAREIRDAAEAGLVQWFGEGWARTDPPLSSLVVKPRPLHMLPKAARRRPTR